MPSYKLTYFNGRGRGELSRYVFHAAGKDFEDKRVTFEEWKSIKPSTLFGQLPFLEVDGKILAQSHAIARFLAREFGLCGKDSFEQALVDQYMELASDLFKDIVKWFFEKDEDKKKELKANLDEVLFPKFCGYFQKALEENGGEYLVGKSLTVADLAVLDIFDTPLQYTPNLMDAFSKLKAHRERISSLPKLADYIKNRGQTPI